MTTRKRTKPANTLEERLAVEASELRQQASTMQPGIERDSLLRKARQDETASQMTAWINSPGLRPPE